MELLGREMGWDGEKGGTWVLDLNQVLIQFPGSEDYGYSAKGEYLYNVGFIHHGVIIVGIMEYRELSSRVSC